ncbi:MAG: hypothetical protein OXG05_14465 [Gammaproteobacteria bacterium]|nr:hypothetical protein [Gammaproteobacteria bacterium]
MDLGADFLSCVLDYPNVGLPAKPKHYTKLIAKDETVDTGFDRMLKEIVSLRSDMADDIASLRSDMSKDIESLRSDMDGRFKGELYT